MKKDKELILKGYQVRVSCYFLVRSTQIKVNAWCYFLRRPTKPNGHNTAQLEIMKNLLWNKARLVLNDIKYWLEMNCMTFKI